jgi:hypothetical protein
MNIKKTKEVIEVGVSLAVAIDKSLEDKFQWLDLIQMVPPMTKLPAALEGAETILEEIQDLDQAERAELANVIEKLDLNSKYSEVIAEQSVVVAVEIGKLVMLIRKAKE